MKLVRATFPSLALAILLSVCGPEGARGQLRWQPPKKEFIRLRLVALAWNHPRSSFFASEEVFVADKELAKDESRLIKLVFDFLPYQPRLSDDGLDYSTLHELLAVRDSQCDETLAQLATGRTGDWRQKAPQLKYAADAPELNLARHKSPLPCYVSNAEDYTKPVHPATEPEP